MHPARIIARAQVLLNRSQGAAGTIHEAVKAIVSKGTVPNINHRYFESSLDRALHDLLHPGAEPKIDREVEVRLIALTCNEPPAGHERWTLRLLAKTELVASINHVAASNMSKKNALDP